MDPLLGMVFDSKFINLDTEHFKNAVIENVGESTFQEGAYPSALYSWITNLLMSRI